MSKYDDIIFLDRPKSYRKKMSISDRAAQFSPFAALTGYDDAINETGRYTDSRTVLDEETYKDLDIELFKIRTIINEKPLVNIKYFIKDDKKAGGKYINKNIKIKKIDDDRHMIICDDNTNIDIDDIYYLKII